MRIRHSPGRGAECANGSWAGSACSSSPRSPSSCFAPGIVENAQNKVEPVALNITPRAAALQKTLDVADMHADLLLWKRDLLTRSTRGMVDLPRLQAGNYALQIFSSVTKTPKGQNYDGNSGDTDNITTLGRRRSPAGADLGLAARTLALSRRQAQGLRGRVERPDAASSRPPPT